MNLDFLRAGGAFSPEGVVARSPMEHLQRMAGARFEVRDGWSIAVDFGSGSGSATERVVWADSSHLPKLEVQGTADAIDAAAGTPLPFGTAVRQDGAWWCRLTSTRALVIGGGGRASTPDGADGVTVLDVTSNFAAITLAGPLAREVFARFCALDLRPTVTPVGGLRPGSVGRQPGILIREAEERYLFLFGWATGEYMWSIVTDAGQHLGGVPIGADALAELGGPDSVSDMQEARSA
jgi:glycine cleavage system aminomethyltransferase T